MTLKTTYPFLTIAIGFGFAVGYYLERSYQSLVQMIFDMNYGDRMHFIGKSSRFNFDHSLTFILISTIFWALVYLLLKNTRDTALKIRGFISALIFLMVTIGTSVFDGFRYVAECTQCGDGPVRVYIERIAYNKHLFCSTFIILLYLLVWFLIDHKRAKSKKQQLS